MSRLADTFTELKKSGRAALIPCLVGGDPDLETTIETAVEIAGRGADILELVIPFSDPMADGPTIQAASLRALAGSISLRKILDGAARLRNMIDIPLVVMTYLNPVLRIGLEEFAKVSNEAGVDGILLPELPIEEADEWRDIAREKNLDTIFMAAPTSTPDRVKAIDEASTGFVYAVTLTGTTGARETLPEELIQTLTDMTALCSKPIAAGFGISGPEAVRSLAPHADGLIVGSALVRLMEEGSKKEKIKKVGRFVAELRAALDPA